MKFDFCIGNPPYQDEDSNRRLYPLLYISACQIANCVEMIFPSAWQEAKNTNGLAILNTPSVKEDRQIVFIDNKEDVFNGILGAKYTNVIMWKRGYDNGLNGCQLVINKGKKEVVKLPLSKEDTPKPAEIVAIAKKIDLLGEAKILSMGSARKPYGFEADPIDNPDKYNITIFSEPVPNCVRLFGRAGGKRTSVYIQEEKLPKKSPLLNSWKLFVVKAWGNMDERNGWLGGSYAEIIVAEPKDCCSEMYIEFGPFNSRKEAENARKYFYTKFFRAVFYKNKMSQNTARETYASVPQQDFTDRSSIDWNKPIADISLQLCHKYGFSKEEIDFIETHIKEME